MYIHRLSAFKGNYMKKVAVLIALFLAGCGGGGSSSTPTPQPTVTLQANALLNGTTDLTWSSTNATTCSLTGSDSETLAPSGTTNVSAPITSAQSYTVACKGIGGTGSKTAAATPPTSFPTNCSYVYGARGAYWIGQYVVGTFVDDTSLTFPCQSATVASDGSIDVISSWKYPITNGMKANPTFVYGMTEPVPGSGAGFGQATAAGVPIQVSKFPSTLGFIYTDTLTGTDLDGVSGSAYDLLFDNYFSSKADLSDEALEMAIDPICVNVCNGVAPVSADTAVIDGFTWKIVYSPSTSHTFSTHPGLGFLCVVSQISANNTRCLSQYTTGTIKIKDFIDYAVSHGYLSTSDYWGNVSIGNEVFAGKATSELNVKFSN